MGKFRAALQQRNSGEGGGAGGTAVRSLPNISAGGNKRVASKSKSNGSGAKTNWRDTPAIVRQREIAAQRGGMQAEPKHHFASHDDEQLYDQDGSFSPRSYAGEDGLGRTQHSAREREFDASGELNAYDNKDALVRIKHILDHANRGGVRLASRNQEDPETRHRRLGHIVQAARTQEGYAVLGQKMVNPIKSIVDYESWNRKFFMERTLKQNEFYRLTKDVRSTAYVIGQDGQGVAVQVFGRYVQPPEFKIGSFPIVDIEDIYQMGYDVLDRAQDTARQEIELEEDKRALAIIDAASTAVNTTIGYTSLGIGALEDVRYQVERHRLQADKFAINRAELSDVIKTMSTQVDPVTERETLLSGYIGSILNCGIVVSAGTGVEEVVPAGTFYCTTAPEYLGEMVTRIELFSEPFNLFAQFRMVKGFAFGEVVGWVCPEPRAAAKGLKG